MVMSTRHAFSYVGAPGTNVTRAKSLLHEGPLVIATDHLVYIMCPNVTEADGARERKRTSQLFMTRCVVAGALFDDEVKANGVHFIITVSRLGTFIKDLEESGMNCAPIALVNAHDDT